MNLVNDIKKELEQLIEAGKDLFNALLPSEEEDCSDLLFFLKEYDLWYSKAIVIVKQLVPERLDDFKNQYKNEKRKELQYSTYTISDALRGITHRAGYYGPSSAIYCMNCQLNILKGCLETFESKIYNIQTILQADIFDSEIDSAKHLLKRGFLRAAGAVCGVLIEKHFSIVCQNHNIVIKKKDPSIANYNDALKDNIYDTMEWRRIQRLGDLRNLCDHSKDREPTKEEVEELISGTERIIKTIF